MKKSNEKIYLQLMSAPYFDDFEIVNQYYDILDEEKRYILLINCSRKNNVKMFIDLHKKGYDIHYKEDDLFFFNIGLGNTKIVEYFLANGSNIAKASQRIFQVAIQGQQLKLLDLFIKKKFKISNVMLQWFDNYKKSMKQYDYYLEYLNHLEKKIQYYYLQQELKIEKESINYKKI